MAELRRLARASAHAGSAPEYWRPRTRGDCQDGFRPCPYVGCRYHLWVDVREKSLHYTHGKGDVDAIRAMEETCALDVADRGPALPTKVGELMQCTLKTIETVTANAFATLRVVAESDDVMGAGVLQASKPQPHLEHEPLMREMGFSGEEVAWLTTILRDNQTTTDDAH